MKMFTRPNKDQPQSDFPFYIWKESDWFYYGFVLLGAEPTLSEAMREADRLRSTYPDVRVGHLTLDMRPGKTYEADNV